MLAIVTSTVHALLIGHGAAGALRCATPQMATPTMPAILSEWGCDEALWDKVRSKNALIKLVEDGDEAGARARLEMVRIDVSETESFELTPQLIEWGVDEELWSNVRNKRALWDLANSGEEAKCRERIEQCRRSIARGDAPRPTPRKEGPYELRGDPPDGVDVAAVEALLAKRSEAKKARDFESADAYQAELLEMKVYVNDKMRYWQAAKAPNGGYTLKGAAPAGVDVAAVEELMARRRDAKKAREYDTADALQAELLEMGVWLDDKARTWTATRKTTSTYTLVGDPPEGADLEAIAALLAKRVEAKRAKDFEAADALQSQLITLGAYPNDRSKTWEAAKWTKNPGARVAPSPAPEKAPEEEAPPAEEA